jgi:hypothetical protein
LGVMPPVSAIDIGCDKSAQRQSPPLLMFGEDFQFQAKFSLFACIVFVIRFWLKQDCL